jgi:hypothetical protein
MLAGHSDFWQTNYIAYFTPTLFKVIDELHIRIQCTASARPLGTVKDKSSQIIMTLVLTWDLHSVTKLIKFHPYKNDFA